MSGGGGWRFVVEGARVYSIFALISMVKVSKNGKQYNFLHWPNVKHNLLIATIKF